MSIETHRVVIGACGWKHSAWLEDFYSEDLPEDWHLGFYSNEFSVVYVPARDWIDDDVSVWSADVSETFRFILELPETIYSDTSELKEFISKAESLNEFCLGLVLPLNQLSGTNTQLFLSCYEQLKNVAPVSVDKRGILLTDEFKALLEQYSISEVWNGVLNQNVSYDAKKLGLMRHNLSITRVSCEELDMPSLRKVIEVSLQASDENRVSVLCFDGQPPSIEMMRNADIILNLL